MKYKHLNWGVLLFYGLLVCSLLFGLSGDIANVFAEIKPVSSSQLPYLSQEIIISALDNEQRELSVAYNSKHNEFLVVWQNDWGGSSDVYAQRVSESGEILSWFAVRGGNGVNDCIAPDVAYDPDLDRYMVVWSYDKNGDGSDWDIHYRFVAWNGSSMEPTYLLVGYSTNQWAPGVVYAHTQKEYLVVWNNESQVGAFPMYISGKRVFADGSGFPSTGSDITISDPTDLRVDVDVAYNLARNEYLLVYESYYDIMATRLRGDAAVLGGGEFTIAALPDQEVNPAVAACRIADQYLVTWQTLVYGDYDIFARFVSGDGTPDTTRLTISEYAGDQDNVDIACNLNGSTYMLTYQEAIITGGISGVLVNADKTINRGFQVAAPGVTPGHDHPTVAGGPSKYLVVWQHQRDATYIDIHGKLVTPHVLFLPAILK